jgi:two-component system cell cycle sensor histidine kinase/response regulator CckA
MNSLPSPKPPLLRRPLFWIAASALTGAAALAPWQTQGEIQAALGLFALAALAGAAWTVARQSSLAASLLLDAAEANPKAHLITTVDGAFVYANSAFHRLFQLSVSLEAMSGIIVGADSAEAFERLVAAAAGGMEAEAEISVKGPMDAVEWRRIAVSPLPGGHALWRAEDVTARREMETVRRQEEEMLADFMDHLPAGFFSNVPDGRILYANQTLAGWLGVSPEDMRGRLVTEFVAEGEDDGEVILKGADGNVLRAFLARTRRTGPKDKTLYDRSMVLRGRLGAGPSKRLHWLFDEAPVGIVILDIGGDVAECNRAFLKLLGLHREAIVGRPLTERISKEDQSDVAAQLSKVVMGIMPAVHMEVRMPGMGHHDLAVSLYASRMEDDDGEVSGLILHFIDTTEQKHLEVQFAQSQKMQAVGQLAGGVAHDFNNLLTAMIGFSDLLLERHDPGDPSFADIMQIKQNANRATNLVRQLLAFSRKQTLKPVLLDPTEALSELSNLLGRLIGETIELTMEHGHDLGLIRVDRGQFDQVIVNLAVNSRDAMPGGGTLSIRSSTVILDEPVHRGHEVMPSGAYVLIEVTDTGGGIAREDIERIFEPFFSTKEVGAGTGLGLSTVYGIVRQTDGFIFVDSAPGEGAAFSIYLPRYEDTGPTAPAPEAPVEVDLTGAGTVLLVEDEDAVRLFGARALRNKGYRVLEASNGKGALDVINGSALPIDLIISDIVMPGMDGRTLVQLVRHEIPNVKVILMSGYAEDMMADGSDPSIHFLAKPFSLKGLAVKVKEVMSGP